MPDHPFGLPANPFADGHDPRSIFPAEKRVEAIGQLRRRIADGESFVVVTGEPGTGKTSAVTEALESGDTRARVAVIAHPSLTPAELLEAVCIEFDAPLPATPSKPQALAALEHHLRDLRSQGAPVVLVLDEAHGLKTELLEEVRLLSNIKAEGRALLQTVLVGLPELERRLGLPELAQLRQRIGCHCRLAPLELEETAGYLRHRADAAGGNGEALFRDETCREIHNYTNGVPRDINTLAGRALEHAYDAGAPAVSVEHVRIAAGDARPRGIATVARPPVGSQPFELRRKAVPGRASASPPPPAPPPPPPEPAIVAPPPPAKPEPRRPPSFLREQLRARLGDSRVAAPPAPAVEPPTLEERFRSGELARPAPDGPAPDAGAAAAAPAWLPRSESAQELGASVLLVGLLLVVLMATGHWERDAAPTGPPAAEAITEPSPGPADETAPEPPGTVHAGARIDPDTPAPRVAPPEASPRPTAPADRADVVSRPAYGFEVAAYAQPESADIVLRKITRGSKLPARIVTKSTGHPYRVVVGPFTRRRDAEVAIKELFRSALVERARLVQLPE